MKNILHQTLTGAAVMIVALCDVNLRAAETNNTTSATRIGVYDSRAVAYAWFWNSNHMSQINKLMQNARDAQAAGNTNRFKELAAKLNEQQELGHREVFSTAPPKEALAELKDRLPEIQKAAGVSALVSKWDDAALKKYPDAEKVDVTDQLVREFIQPTPQQEKVLSEMKKAAPVPLDQAMD
jgi:hypothetical protein